MRGTLKLEEGHLLLFKWTKGQFFCYFSFCVLKIKKEYNVALEQPQSE